MGKEGVFAFMHADFNPAEEECCIGCLIIGILIHIALLGYEIALEDHKWYCMESFVIKGFILISHGKNKDNL